MLRILFPGVRNSLSTLASSAFTRQNYGATDMTSARITADSPDGALGGMVATMSGNYEVDICDGTTEPVGFFLLDAVGSPFENTPTVASGKLTYMHNQGSYETDIYETKDEGGSSDLTYAVGEMLYCSKNGLITKDDSTSSREIGIVTKAPTSTDPFLAFNARI